MGRFYAFSVGEAKKPGNAEAGLEECRRWFTTALTLHSVVPVALILIGYPTGEWAIRSFLVVPAERMEACIWVWRWVALTSFVAMLNVPFQAMYTAKQNIAELTIYSFATTTLNVFVLYYMVCHPSDWLARYAAWIMLTSVVPQLIICIRAFVIYPECRISRAAAFNWRYIRPVLEFAGGRLVNGLSMMVAGHGQAIVVNKYLGPVANATMTVGNQVSTHAQSLASSMAGALYPAITNAAGEGRMDEMRRLALRASKLSVVSMLVFMVPLALEMPYILKVWLVRPLPFGAELCVLLLAAATIERMTDGNWMAIFAVGRIFAYQVSVSTCGFFMLAVGWTLVWAGCGVVGVGISHVAGIVLAMFFRLGFGRRIAGLSIRTWFRAVFLPVILLAASSLAAGWLPRLVMEPSFVRVVVTTAMSLAAFLPTAWFFALDGSERSYLLSRFRLPGGGRNKE